MREVDLLQSKAVAAGAWVLGLIGVGLIAVGRYLTDDDDGLVIDWGSEEEDLDDPA